MEELMNHSSSLQTVLMRRTPSSPTSKPMMQKSFPPPPTANADQSEELHRLMSLLSHSTTKADFANTLSRLGSRLKEREKKRLESSHSSRSRESWAMSPTTTVEMEDLHELSGRPPPLTTYETVTASSSQAMTEERPTPASSLAASLAASLAFSEEGRNPTRSLPEPVFRDLAKGRKSPIGAAQMDLREATNPLSRTIGSESSSHCHDHSNLTVKRPMSSGERHAPKKANNNHSLLATPVDEPLQSVSFEDSPRPLKAHFSIREAKKTDKCDDNEGIGITRGFSFPALRGVDEKSSAPSEASTQEAEQSLIQNSAPADDDGLAIPIPEGNYYSQSQSGKAPTEATLSKLQRSMMIVENIWVAVIMLLTIISIIGDDLITLTLPPAIDRPFMVFTGVVIGLFLLDILRLSLQYPMSYWNTFLFYLDIVSTVTLIPAILPLFGVPDITTAASALTVTRMGRVVKIASRVGRVLRFFRMFFKCNGCVKGPVYNEDDEVQKLMNDDRDMTSKIGKRMEEVTNRNVMMTVMAMFFATVLLDIIRESQAEESPYTVAADMLSRTVAGNNDGGPIKIPSPFPAFESLNSMVNGKLIQVTVGGTVIYDNQRPWLRKAEKVTVTSRAHGGISSTIILDARDIARREAILSISLVVFISLLLVFSSWSLMRTLKAFVIRPLERMVEVLEEARGRGALTVRALNDVETGEMHNMLNQITLLLAPPDEESIEGMSVSDNVIVTEEMKTELRRTFDSIDTDRGGGLDVVELRDAFVKMGQDVDINDVRKLVAAVDENSNGSIDFNEFVNLYKFILSNPDKWKKFNIDGLIQGPSFMDDTVAIDEEAGEAVYRKTPLLERCGAAYLKYIIYRYGRSAFASRFLGRRGNDASLIVDVNASATNKTDAERFRIADLSYDSKESPKTLQINNAPQRRSIGFGLISVPEGVDGTAERRGSHFRRIHIMSPQDFKKAKRLQMWVIGRAMIAGAISSALAGILEIGCNSWWPGNGQETFPWNDPSSSPSKVRYWVVLSLGIIILSVLEVLAIYADSLFQAVGISTLAGLKLFPLDEQRSIIIRAMSRTALELGHVDTTFPGIDPSKFHNKVSIFVSRLAYKLKTSITTFIARILFRRVLGRTFARAALFIPFVATPLIMMWNAVIAYLVMKEMWSLEFGPPVFIELVETILRSSPRSYHMRRMLFRALGVSVAAKGMIHPNVELMLTYLKSRTGGLNPSESIDEWRVFLKGLAACSSTERENCIHMFFLGLVADGTYTPKCRRYLRKVLLSCKLGSNIAGYNAVALRFFRNPNSLTLDSLQSAYDRVPVETFDMKEQIGDGFLAKFRREPIL